MLSQEELAAMVAEEKKHLGVGGSFCTLGISTFSRFAINH